MHGLSVGLCDLTCIGDLLVVFALISCPWLCFCCSLVILNIKMLSLDGNRLVVILLGLRLRQVCVCRFCRVGVVVGFNLGLPWSSLSWQ